MSPLHVETPVWPSPWFARRAARPVLLKMEALQPSGSFKIRGIGALCRLAAERGRTRFVCPSGGNAGLAAAHACRGLGASLTVFVPRTTKERTRRLLGEAGARVEVEGPDWQASHEAAKEYAVRFGAELVHPFDDRMIWEGHATLVEELARQLVGPPAGIVLSVGGGGLLGGVLLGLERVGWVGVPLHAVETRGAACFAAACAAGEVRSLPAITSIATSLGAREVSRPVFERARAAAVRSHVVEDAAAVRAVRDLLDAHRVLVEPACGAALAALGPRMSDRPGDAPLVVIVCGGSGVSLNALLEWEASLGES